MEKNLKGEALFDYMATQYSNEEYRSIVKMLPYALNFDFNEACKLLEKTIEEGLTLVVIYPSQGESAQENWKFIGDVIDGAMYLKPH